MGLPGDLEIVVVEADRAEGERDAEHDPDIAVGRIGPQQRRRPRCPSRIISPPMVGVPFLVTRCDCGPSVRIGWPLPCCSAQLVDDPRPEQEHEDQRRDHRAAGADGDVAEDVEDVELCPRMKESQ